MKNMAYQRITERIVSLLAQGTVPWHKPWRAKTGWPRNYVSQKQYRGINVFLLHAASYESPCWLTFRQALQLGGNVKKGEKSCPVVFWKRLAVEDKKSGETEMIPLLRFYHVFNVTQCEQLKNVSAPVESVSSDISKPEDIVANMPKPPTIKHGMTKAFYSPSEDCVGMPFRERFERVEDYYSAIYHELVHSTGNEKRLGRFNPTELEGYGSDPYSKEELVAEMGAALLCGQAEIAERTIDGSAAYIKGWLGKLQADPMLIVQAAAQAQKAADFILGRMFQESEAAHE